MESGASLSLRVRTSVALAPFSAMLMGLVEMFVGCEHGVPGVTCRSWLLLLRRSLGLHCRYDGCGLLAGGKKLLLTSMRLVLRTQETTAQHTTRMRSCWVSLSAFRSTKVALSGLRVCATWGSHHREGLSSRVLEGQVKAMAATTFRTFLH